jgi:hypothetical protein
MNAPFDKAFRAPAAAELGEAPAALEPGDLASPVPRARRPQLRPVPAAVTAAVTRGVCRWMDEQGFASLTEFKLTNGRRADVIGLSAKGTILMVEVKSTVEDFRGDAKWLEYVPYCDAFAFAVPPHFPWHILPETCGVLVADAHAAMIMRPSPHHPLHGSRRRTLTLHFALAAGQRLQSIVDPRV